MIAPKVAVKIDPRLKLPALPEKPRRLSTQPPMKAPTIPMRIVTMMPPGSGPGMTHFARMPAISPTTIQAMIAPMLMALHLPLSTARLCRTRPVSNITDGVRRATFARFYPPVSRRKPSREQVLQGWPDKGEGEEHGGAVEEGVDLTRLAPGELDQDVGDEAEPYPVGDVEGKRQRQDGKEGGDGLVEPVPGDEADGCHHQKADDYERRGRNRGDEDLALL